MLKHVFVSVDKLWDFDNEEMLFFALGGKRVALAQEKTEKKALIPPHLLVDFGDPA